MASQELASRPTCDSTLRMRHFFLTSFQTLLIHESCVTLWMTSWYPPAAKLKNTKEMHDFTQNHNIKSSKVPKKRSHRRQWPSTPVSMWNQRSRQLTWRRLPWTISSRTSSCSQGWSGKAEWWRAKTEPTGSVSGRSPVRKTHFSALLDKQV